MKTCYEAGTLRAYLDGELSAQEMPDLTDHLADCATCDAQLAELRALDERVQRSFLALVTTDADSASEVALARVRSHMTPSPSRGSHPLRSRNVVHGRRRPAFAAAAIAAALLIALLVPAVRTAADSLLQVFRGQSVIFVSVPQSRLQQLENLQVDANTMFLAKPTAVGNVPAPQQVSSLAQAGPLLGFTPNAPSGFPSAPTATTYTVQGQTAYQMRVNVQTLWAVLAVLGITDVTIPDALGAQPISVVMPPSIQMRYEGDGYSVSLIEGTSPIVNLPPGVDLSQLGKAVLEVFGMSSSQAATLSKQIDWNSTIVFPFPVGTNGLQQVTVNGTPGVLLNTGAGAGLDRHSSSCQAPCPTPGANQGQPNAGPDNAPHTLIYWQKGSRFYILDAQGNIGTTEALAIADSLS
ncbi:MAG: anti-sigma factor family protein [Ktedonobacterales bacterium]